MLIGAKLTRGGLKMVNFMCMDVWEEGKHRKYRK